ncbi:anthranilate synthase component II [Dethiosulfatarculus sandiegensis]|uniref:Anthranilate synthase subunit II n=1 Tax=Dethiosulfatarculus sandiegensis TaxID=1429043 RepID=A0A0D2J3M7_9BACT|nr:aminodeoxychorismate/anthranilate synthase component II [Dethiosulfatarculus sandiegensis]KIX12794.1 anthranilate synthase subunit II [Dethiosulfatarculus sandiegensis]
MILLIDNYDSFTFNIAQVIGSLGLRCQVIRNDILSLEQIKELSPQAIMISPGPGRPEKAGISCEVVKALAGKLPILGICLGHQAIAHAFGGEVTRAKEPVHGKLSEMFHDGKTIFKGLGNPFKATRYHSLVVREETLPAELKASAFSLDGQIMGIRSRKLMLEGVQFHPESIATSQGKTIFCNFFNTYLGMRLDPSERPRLAGGGMPLQKNDPNQTPDTLTGNLP